MNSGVNFGINLRENLNMKKHKQIMDPMNAASEKLTKNPEYAYVRYFWNIRTDWYKDCIISNIEKQMKIELGIKDNHIFGGVGTSTIYYPINIIPVDVEYAELIDVESL